MSVSITKNHTRKTGKRQLRNPPELINLRTMDMMPTITEMSEPITVTSIVARFRINRNDAFQRLHKLSLWGLIKPIGKDGRISIYEVTAWGEKYTKYIRSGKEVPEDGSMEA